MRIWLAQINPTVGDVKGNTQKIIDHIRRATEAKADILLGSELCVSGYPPEDLLLQKDFLESCEKALLKIAEATPNNLTVIVGVPRQNPCEEEKPCLNSAVLLRGGKIVGYYNKILLPTYDVFDEKRYFEAGMDIPVWDIGGKKVVITICEDIWEHSNVLRFTSYKRDPIEEIKELHPDLVLNLSASPYNVGKLENRIQVGIKAAQSISAPLVLCNQVGGNDSIIFDGFSYLINEKGHLIYLANGFKEEGICLHIQEKPAPIAFVSDSIQNLYDALVLGLKDYFTKLGFKKACLGLSGGIDSALVACIAADALGPENVVGVVMPSRYSSKESVSDSVLLAKNLGIEVMEIPIEAPFIAYLNLLEPKFKGMPQDSTEENLQARIRGMILMALSNKYHWIVLSTGNKSEFAMGYCTLYGDLCGGLAVISDVYKTQVYDLAKWINRNKVIIPEAIIRKPPSAELKPNQKDSDTLPEYAVLDPILKDSIEEFRSAEEIAKKQKLPVEFVKGLIRKVHKSEYKRKQAPPGLRVTERAFTVGRRFPIVQRWDFS